MTKTTGVCEKHWPPGYERIRKKVFDRPKHPPSVFHGIPATFLPQTLVSSPRETDQYQGGHLFGFSVDKPDRPAKRFLALMVARVLQKNNIS